MLNGPIIVTSVVLQAILLDVLLGEPKRRHPLAGFGSIAQWLEQRLNRSSASLYRQFFGGIISWLLLVVVPTLIIVITLAGLSAIPDIIPMTDHWPTASLFVTDLLLPAIILYFCIGYRSLRQHTTAVLAPLLNNDMDGARQQLAMMVSRDTETLDKTGIRKATIESVLENGNDAVFAPLFWFLIGGVPAVLVYRFANTLDAMWGYKTPQFLVFGRFSARMDDILNWLPARLVACSYSLLGNTRQAIECWRKQAGLLESPNAGVVMTSGAGALSVELGGNCLYHGIISEKPTFGCSRLPDDGDIQRSVQLVDRTLLLWCCVIGFTALAGR